VHENEAPHGIDLSTYEGRLRLDEFAVKVGLTPEQLAALPQTKYTFNAEEKSCGALDWVAFAYVPI